MAEFKTTVALEIGAQSVTMGVFTPVGKGFALSRYARKDILLDPVEEGMRMDYVSSAISEMVTELKVKGSDVRNVVSGQQVFMRFIKLPALDINDIKEQVGYEAQQHIPFPLEDIIYSYQLLDERDGEREVLLVAIKKDVLDKLNTQVEESGLNTRSVDCSITSLYNAFRISYPEETESVMILDIGAKTTDIIFSENGRFFTRSVTAAGSFITSSIAREFNMSYRDAERFKIEQGQVSLGNGHTDAMGEQEAALASTIRTAMQRLSSEVLRTINHYRMQYKGNPPVKAYVCGGGARLPFAVEFLQSVLNIPVEYLNPLTAFAIGNKVDTEALEMDALSMGPIAGAVITGAKIGEFGIDLVPTSVGKDRAELQMLPKVIAGGLVALAGAGFYAYATNAAASEAEAMVRKAHPRVASVEKLSDEVARQNKKYDTAMASVNNLGGMFTMRTAYADVLKQLSEYSASVNFWYTEFSPMINYDVQNSTLKEGVDIKGRRLIDMTKSANGNNSSAINEAPENPDMSKRSNAPKVTAIFVSGYTFKAPGKEKDTDAQRTISDLVVNSFSEINKASLFDFHKEQVDKDSSRYFSFLTADKAKGKALVPSYVNKFFMVMPLKSPIAIPELTPDKK